jgi:hypothetical protein
MLPSDQCLNGTHPAIVESHDGLIEHSELAPLDGASEISLELEPAHGVCIHPQMEHCIPGLAMALRLVHGQIGIPQQIVRSAFAWAANRDADTGGNEHIPATEAEWSGKVMEDPVGHQARFLRLSNTFEKNRELVAAQTGDGILRSQAGLDAPGNRQQELVTDVVSQAVVNQLEIVEVKEKHGDRLAVAFGTRKSVGQPIQEQGAIREAGQRIRESLMGERFLEFFPLTDVPVGCDNAANARVRKKVGCDDL